MTDPDTYGSDWIAAWITRQRDILTQSSQTRAAETEAAELGRRWSEAGQAFFDAMRQAVGSANAPETNATLDPFNIGDAMLGAWTSATMFQSSVAEQLSEFLRRLPPIGLAREQTEAWRELAAAQAECKRLEHELRSMLAKVQLDALDLLERRVSERDAKQPIASFRELYDLWVECGEQVYGKLAHSAAYSKLQAELGNATMRLRTRVQTVLEYGLKQFDLPTRSELNSLHRQVRELRLELERVQTQTTTQQSSPELPKKVSDSSSSRKRGPIRKPGAKMASRLRGNDGPGKAHGRVASRTGKTKARPR
jgi:class III poly(R)-hydroxyalkanoic acid synthase PhaE subunit